MTSALVALASTLAAQVAIPPPEAPPEKPALHYAGKPMRVDFQCTNDDILSAGMTCSEDEPCPIYLELAAVESVGSKIFLAGNLHSAASTLYTILLASHDSGKTWAEPYDRLHGCALD